MTPKLINIRPNFSRLHYGSIIIWFSYETPVGFATSQTAAVRQNEWGPITGKHLNEIDSGDKEGRIPGPEFEARLQQVWPEPSV